MLSLESDALDAASLHAMPSLPQEAARLGAQVQEQQAALADREAQLAELQEGGRAEVAGAQGTAEAAQKQAAEAQRELAELLAASRAGLYGDVQVMRRCEFFEKRHLGLFWRYLGTFIWGTRMVSLPSPAPRSCQSCSFPPPDISCRR